MEEQNKISVATYVKRVNDRFGENGNIVHAIATNATNLTSLITNALFDVGVDLAESIQNSLVSKETLSRADNKHPKSTTPVAVDREMRSESGNTWLVDSDFGFGLDSINIYVKI
jgi:hypothetical protein